MLNNDGNENERMGRHTYDHVTAIISWIHRQPKFLTNGAWLCACESSAMKSCTHKKLN